MTSITRLTKVAGVQVVETLQKYLEDSDAKKLAEELSPLPDPKQNNPRLIVDVTQTEWFSASALARLVFLNKRYTEGKGKLVFCRFSELMAEYLIITQLDKVFEVANNLTEALIALGVAQPLPKNFSRGGI